MLIEIVFLIILLGVVLTLLKYTQEGDIKTFNGKCPRVSELLKMYGNKDEVVNRLFNLFSYQENYVRWNRFLVIAMFTAIVILYFKKGEGSISVIELILVASFIFLAIDLPNRWGTAHVKSGVLIEANRLMTMYQMM